MLLADRFMRFKNYIIIAVLIVLNGILNLKELNLVVTIPEIIVVLFFLTKKNTKDALFWHTIFFITSFSNIFTEEFLFLNGISSHVSYNYANFSFHGFRYSLIITYLIVLFQTSIKKRTISATQTAFYKFYRFLLYCIATGFILGTFGLFLLDYSFDRYLLYGYYSLLCFGFALSYLNEYDTQLKDEFYEAIPFIISIAVVFDFICTILGFNENLIVIGSTSIGAYCFILIPMLLFKKRSLPYLMVVGLQLYLMSVHTSGKQIYSLIFMFAASIILSFSNTIRDKVGGLNLSKMRIVFIVVLIAYPTLQQIISDRSDDQEGNFVRKLESVNTLSSFFMGEGNMDEVSASPYIRLAEFSNIVYEDIRNPVFLLFGRGFGGYYRDELNLFTSFDLASGAFSDDQIRTGNFSYGHDTFVTVPMLNGFIGFFLLIALLISMCKKSPHNYLYLSCLMLPLLWFYFDVLMGVIGVMLLYAAEHKVQKT